MSSTNFQPGTVVQSVWLDEVDSASFPYLAAVTGTNTITAQGPQSYTAYTQQAGFILVPQATNTGAVTLNITGLGAKAVTKYGSTALVAGDLTLGVVAYIVYDGTRFQLLNPQTVAARITETGGGPNSYTITPSGGVTMSGAPAVSHGRAFIPSGSIVFSGTAPVSTGVIITPTGGVTLSGTATIVRGKAFLPSGAITFSGTAPLIRGNVIVPTGVITFTGTAPITYNGGTPGTGTGTQLTLTFVGKT